MEDGGTRRGRGMREEQNKMRGKGKLEAGSELLKLRFLMKFKGKKITFLEESGVIPPRNIARKTLHSMGGSNKRKPSLEQELELILLIMPQCLRYN